MKVKFLVAEEVRPEASNKMSIVGFYPGDVIVMLKKERPQGVPQGVPEGTPEGFERLAILATISDAPEGTHKFKGRLIEPSGDAYAPESPLGEAAIPKGFSHVVVVELKPFIVKQAGTYTYEFFVDDEIFKFPFEVRIQEVQK
jgi:hypothetical protein